MAFLARCKYSSVPRLGLIGMRASRSSEHWVCAPRPALGVGKHDFRFVDSATGCSVTRLKPFPFVPDAPLETSSLRLGGSLSGTPRQSFMQLPPTAAPHAVHHDIERLPKVPLHLEISTFYGVLLFTPRVPLRFSRHCPRGSEQK